MLTPVDFIIFQRSEGCMDSALDLLFTKVERGEDRISL